MSKLTELQAVEESMELWKWLSENPTLGKEDHPQYHSKYIEYDNYCPLCEFYIKKKRIEGNIDCGKCFLKDNHDPDNVEVCCREFYKWVGSDKNGNFKVSKKNRVKYATIIYEKIKVKYDELSEGNEQ